jgi:ribosomal protein L21E
MAFKWYHGKTGVIWNVTKRAVGVEVNKQVCKSCLWQQQQQQQQEQFKQ